MLSNTPYVQTVIANTNPQNTRGQGRAEDIFTRDQSNTILKVAKDRKLTCLYEVLAAKHHREMLCNNTTANTESKKQCANEIAKLNVEILLLRKELNSINSLLPNKFTEAEKEIVNPPMYGGRKYVINSIKNSKTKYKSHRKQKHNKSYRSRKLKSRKFKR